MAGGLIGQIGVLLELDSARYTSDLGKAAADTGKFAQDITGHFTKVQGAITAVVAAIGAFTVADKVNELAKFRSELERISLVSGSTVENISVLGQAAKLSGTDMGTVEGALVKLTKGLSASNAETKDTALALQYLGVQGRDAAGKLRDPGVVMVEVDPVSFSLST